MRIVLFDCDGRPELTLFVKVKKVVMAQYGHGESGSNRQVFDRKHQDYVDYMMAYSRPYREGPWYYFNSDGDIIRSERWHNDALVGDSGGQTH